MCCPPQNSTSAATAPALPQRRHCHGTSTTTALALPRHHHCWSQSITCTTWTPDSQRLLISQLLINKPHNPLDLCGDAAPCSWIQDQGLPGNTNPPCSSHQVEGLPPASSLSGGSRGSKAGTLPNSRAAGSENNCADCTPRAALTWSGQRRWFFNQQPGAGRGQQLKHEQPSGTVCVWTAWSSPATASLHHSPQPRCCSSHWGKGPSWRRPRATAACGAAAGKRKRNSSQQGRQ